MPNIIDTISKSIHDLRSDPDHSVNKQLPQSQSDANAPRPADLGSGMANKAATSLRNGMKDKEAAYDL